MAKRAAGSSGAADLVDELHHRGDRRVEREAAVDVVGDLGDRLMRLARQRRVDAATAELRRLLEHDPPEPVQEAPDALEALVLPVHVLVGGAHEER